MEFVDRGNAASIRAPTMGETDSTPLGLLRRACDAEFGIMLAPMPESAARDLRRYLYSERERQRRKAISDFDR